LEDNNLKIMKFEQSASSLNLELLKLRNKNENLENSLRKGEAELDKGRIRVFELENEVSKKTYEIKIN